MDKATTEFEIKISSGRITNVNAVLENGICKLTIETAAQDEPTEATVAQEKTANTDLTDAFVFVGASELSLDDEFMKYKPKTKKEENLMKELTELIKKGVKDFWAPKYDPSFNKERTGICYVPGEYPAINRSYEWWEKAAKEFCPERQSHLGSKSERVAFLGWYIKKIVESRPYPYGSVESAWHITCVDSKVLGHYNDLNYARRGLEKTGSREAFGFFDLANTYKILAYDEEARGFWVAGGGFDTSAKNCPLADLRVKSYKYEDLSYCVGWVVMPAA